MGELQPLIDELNKLFDLSPQHTHLLAGLLIEMIDQRTVVLSQLAEKIPGYTKPVSPASNEQRLRRFFAEQELDVNEVGAKVLQIVGAEPPYILAIDRTNWKNGESNINFLVLSVIHKGYAIPVYWELLDKRGNSNAEERIALIDRLLKRFDKEEVDAILIDREFTGQQWYRALVERQIHCIGRIKNNQIIGAADKSSRNALCVSEQIEPMSSKGLSSVYVSGLPGSVSVTKNDDSVMAVFSTNTDRSAENILKLYRKRWEIESFFQSTKGRGFEFEKTSMTRRSRLMKLFAVVSIAFAWCYRVGIQSTLQKPIKKKRQGRPEQSLVRRGLKVIRSVLGQFNRKSWLYHHIFKYLDPEMDTMEPIAF